VNSLSRLLYQGKAWLEHFARTPQALGALTLTAVVEAAVFPIPPDVLFIALSASHPRRAFVYALLCFVGSTIGAFLGYAIGYALFESVGRPVLGITGMEARFSSVLAAYREHVWPTLLLAGFTNIPFSVFTIAAGFRKTIDPVTFALAASAGRAIRFFSLGALLFVFGPRVKVLIDRYLPVISLAVLLAFIGIVIAAHWGF
jgi:membrane protein YqaA with SNARE-associated domain